jgi:predicted Rossmann fold nucleotide-binding protein DprA/Smf involved in DNA uptake
MTSKEFNWLRLHLTCGLGRAGLLRLMEAFQTPEAILDAKPASWTERAGIRPSVAASLPKENDPELLRTIERMEKLGVAVISLWDNHYPPALRTIYDPPVLLYQLGQLPETDCFAVVGARKASEAGRRLTAQISSELAARNISIVSGLARGIDSAAHQGALEKGSDRCGSGVRHRSYLSSGKRCAVSSHCKTGSDSLGIFPWHSPLARALSRAQPDHQRPQQRSAGGGSGSQKRFVADSRIRP